MLDLDCLLGRTRDGYLVRTTSIPCSCEGPESRYAGKYTYILTLNDELIQNAAITVLGYPAQRDEHHFE